MYLMFDLFLLNFAIIVVAIASMSERMDAQQEMVIYILHANLSWVVTYFFFSKKNLYLRDGYLNRLQRISKRTVIFILVLGISGFLLLPKSYSRTFLAEFALVFYTWEVIFYYFLYHYLKIQRSRGAHINTAVIVGYNETTQLLHRVITANYLLGYKFLGYLCSTQNDNEQVIGCIEELESLIQEKKIQVVFATQGISDYGQKNKELLRICNRHGIRLRIVPENQRFFKKRYNMESVGSLVVLNPQETPLDDMGNRLFKRFFDIVFSLTIILAVFSWLFPVIAILIKLSSKGPVFFIQKRTGIDQRPFNCIKFRSMDVNQEADSKQATANDVRITKIGAFIRKYNIDELPQFFNVLVGQMSVVGPRPHMLKHTEQYSALIEYYLTRHYVKPGITGWAQVNGLRGETDELWKMEKRVEYDKEYIENWDLDWDLRIIWMTIFGNKAYKNAG
jgi:Undecaprenyl-phosphate glucose phosphotransferase